MRLVLALLLALFALPAQATTYYISASGSDGAAGSLAAPWATPNHAVACTDTIFVKPGSYTTGQLTTFGTVSGASQSCQAKLYCGDNGARVALNQCMVTGAGFAAIEINKSGWDVRGFNTTAGAGPCIVAVPRTNADIAYITEQDNIASGCIYNGVGFTAANNSGARWNSVDYITIQNNIAYNAAISASAICDSGISGWQPYAIDNNPGPHMIVRGNFSYSNFNSWTSAGAYCGTALGLGNVTLDGEGLIWDTPCWDSGYGNDGYCYPALTIIESNIFISNGAPGFTCTKCAKGPIIFRNNTLWNNSLDAHRYCCGSEAQYGSAGGTVFPTFIQTYNNITASNTATCCASGAFPGNNYGMWEGNGSQSTVPYVRDIYDWNVSTNLAHAGQNTNVENGSFSFSSTNTLGTDPQFTNPGTPGAPNCTGMADVPSCLRNVDGAGFDVIARFTPTNAAIKGLCSHAFQAAADIINRPWLVGNNCDPGAIKWSN